jgi:signal transduction histidine kinase
VAEAIERIRTAAEQHGVKINFDEPETNQVVFGDRRQLTSALHALLENAVVYSPSDGTVDIHVRRHRSRLSRGG